MVASRRPWRARPVSGSKRPVRHHMPSPSTQLRSRVARRWRSKRAMASSALDPAHLDGHRPRTAPRGWTPTATSTSRSARQRARGRWWGSSCRNARPMTSTWPPDTVPAARASPSGGMAWVVRARSSTRPASRRELRAAWAMACSGKEATWASLGGELHVASVQPGPQPGSRRHRGAQLVLVPAGRIDRRHRLHQPLHRRHLHTNKRTPGVKQALAVASKPARRRPDGSRRVRPAAA